MSAHITPDELTVGASDAATLVVSEIFGPTFQGEGPSLGRRCVFLRLGGCNLHCRWCDTAYTWDWTGRNGTVYNPRKELRRLEVAAVWQALCALGTETLVVSGGEPMLQQSSLLPLLEEASESGWWVEIETAGTVAPHEDVVPRVSRFNVSPKLANSGNSLEERYSPQILEAFQGTKKAVWKFVVEQVSDLDGIDNLVQRHSLTPVYVMPEGVRPEVISARSKALAEAVLSRGWNLTTRLHILLYGDRRGL